MLSCVFWNQTSEICHEITCALVVQDQVVTGSASGEICYWNNGKPYILSCCSSQTSCLYLTLAASPNKLLLSCKSMLVSLHRDLKIRTWDFDDGRCMNCQKITETAEIIGLESSQNRILALLTSHSCVLYDAFSLTSIRVLRLESRVSSVKFIKDSKIVLLNSDYELMFWNYSRLNVTENPFFVFKIGERCSGFCIDENYRLLAIVGKEQVQFRRMDDLKFNNHVVGVLKQFDLKEGRNSVSRRTSLCPSDGKFLLAGERSRKASEASFAGFDSIEHFAFVEGFFVVTIGDMIYRYSVTDILAQLETHICFQMVKELDLEHEKTHSSTDRHLSISDTKLVSIRSSTLIIEDLLDFPLSSKSLVFKFNNASIAKLNINETITFSSILMRPWPLMLIGTSSGQILLRSLNPECPQQSYHFHSSPVTCIEICKECIISCTDDSFLCIYHPDNSTGYCSLLSPAHHIYEVSCIQDTVHNISDSFWKNSWKNWDETILVHCQDLSVSLVSLVTNSIICNFHTQIAHVSEAMVHVLLEYLIIRSHELVYVFNMMTQTLERISSGVNANELMRRPAAMSTPLDSNSSEDLISDEHKMIEINWRSCNSSSKSTYSSFISIQNISNPVINFSEDIPEMHWVFVLSLLSCWDKNCSSHESMSKSFPEMKEMVSRPMLGIKGDTWQTYFLQDPVNTSKLVDSLRTMHLLKISSLGCSLLKPSFGVLTYKSLQGNSFLQSLIRDLTATITNYKKLTIIAICKSILHFRTPSSVTVQVALSILGSLRTAHMDSEWKRVKYTVAESQAALILAYFAGELDKKTNHLVFTTLFAILRSTNSIHIACSSKAIIHTYPLWKSLLAGQLKNLIKELILLSSFSATPVVFFKTLGALVATDFKTYLAMVAEEIMTAEGPARKAWLSSLKWLANRKYDQLAQNIQAAIEAVLKTLNPHNPLMRKNCLEQSSEILQLLVLKLPMVAFSQSKQKIAAGTSESTIIVYDLKTAAFWKCLEGHKAAVSAVTFTRTGDNLISYSAQDLTVCVWRIEVGFFQGLVGVKILRPSNVTILPEVRRTVSNYKEFLDCVDFQWKNETLKLIREDSKTYALSITL